MTTQIQTADFQIENHGSTFLVQPLNGEAFEHLWENVGEEALWFGGALVVEPRYIIQLAQGLECCGYTVR